MNTEKEKAEILQYLEYTYSGAKMMDDVEIMTRVARAIFAFNADIDKDIFKEDIEDEM